MQRKLKIPLSMGDTVTLLTLNGLGPFHFKLTQFKIADNRLEWEMRSSDGHTLYAANVREQCKLPYLKDTGSFICVSIPVKLHVSPAGLLTDFIFSLPTSVDVEKNHSIAKGVDFYNYIKR